MQNSFNCNILYFKIKKQQYRNCGVINIDIFF